MIISSELQLTFKYNQSILNLTSMIMEHGHSNKSIKLPNISTDTSIKEIFCLVSSKEVLPLMKKVGTL